MRAGWGALLAQIRGAGKINSGEVMILARYAGLLQRFDQVNVFLHCLIGTLAFEFCPGVELHPHVGIEGWQIENGRVTGVLLANGTVAPAKQFLVAAGPWSERLLGSLNCRPGVHPIRGQILLLKTEAETLRHTLIAGKRYLVPRGDGRVLVGSTEEPEAGFAKQTTPAGLEELRAFAIEMVPESI